MADRLPLAPIEPWLGRVAPGSRITGVASADLKVAWKQTPVNADQGAASGAAPTGFLLNVTGAFVSSVPTALRELSGAVGAGSYDFSVLATNACGTSAPTPVQTVVVP